MLRDSTHVRSTAIVHYLSRLYTTVRHLSFVCWLLSLTLPPATDDITVINTTTVLEKVIFKPDASKLTGALSKTHQTFSC